MVSYTDATNYAETAFRDALLANTGDAEAQTRRAVERLGLGPRMAELITKEVVQAFLKRAPRSGFALTTHT